MKNNLCKNFFVGLILITIFVTPFLALVISPALAQTPPPDPTQLKNLQNASELTNQFAAQGGYKTENSLSIEFYIGRILSVLLSFLGVFFLILIVYGGYAWLTAAGNEEKITKAKNLIIHSIIGLLIVFAAFMISYFIIYTITTVTGVAK